MPAVVTLGEVQGWLEVTKLTIAAFDAELENTAQVMAFGMLSDIYDTGAWTSPDNTPVLVSKAIAMLVAAWTYNRQYSEEDPSGNAYALWLEQKAYALLEGIKQGDIDLPEVPGIAASAGTVSFYPDDSTGAMQQYDDSGHPVGPVGGAARKFSMGTVW